MLNGYDVSNHQTGLNLSSLTGAQFIIVKASESNSWQDPSYKAFQTQARQLGLLRGAYHYMRGTNPDSQVSNFLNVVKSNGDLGSVMLFLDVEEKGITGNQVEAFARTLYSRTGQYPVIYISQNMLKNGRWTGSYVKEHCPIWLAEWYTEPQSSFPTGYPFTREPAGYRLFGWQFTSTWKSGNQDADVSYWDPATWKAWAEGNTGTSSETASKAQASAVQGNKWLVARDVINGKYGNGQVRRNKLGSRYTEIQTCVNALLNESDNQLATRVIAGELGNGQIRKTILGSRYQAVQNIVNRRLKK